MLRQVLQQQMSPPNFGKRMPKTVATMRRMKLLSMFRQLADRHDYNHPTDYLLCFLFPVYEADCRAYYSGGGKTFLQLYGRDAWLTMDEVCSDALYKTTKEASNRDKKSSFGT